MEYEISYAESTDMRVSLAGVVLTLIPLLVVHKEHVTKQNDIISYLLFYLFNPYVLYAFLWSPWKLIHNAPFAVLFAAVHLQSTPIIILSFLTAALIQPYAAMMCAFPTLYACIHSMKSAAKVSKSDGSTIVFDVVLVVCAAVIITIATMLPQYSHVQHIILLIKDPKLSLMSLYGVRELFETLYSAPLHQLATVDAGTNEPELSIYWYLFATAFKRYMPYFTSIAAGLPAVCTLPLFFRFRHNPVLFWLLQFGLVVILDPTSQFTIQRVVLLLQMALLFPQVIKEMKQMHFWCALWVVGLLVSPALKYVWIQSQNGNANLLWIQQMTFPVASGFILNEFAAAALRLTKPKHTLKND